MRTYTKINSLIFLFSLISLSVRSQSFDEKEFLKNIANLRGDIYLNDLEQIKKMNLVWDYWKTNTGKSDKELGEQIQLYLKYRFGPPLVRKLLIRSDLKPYVNLETIDEYAGSSEILDLIEYGFVLPYPPFFLKKNNLLLNELEFYEFQKGQSIAEIGAGSGFFSICLGLLGLDLKVQVNELKRLTESITYNLSMISNRLPEDKFKVISGDKHRANLVEKADKIIVRNAFHHFKKRSEMLADLKESLSEDGRLYIMEYFEGGCRKQIPVELLKGIIEKEGWQLTKEKTLDDRIVQEYRVLIN